MLSNQNSYCIEDDDEMFMYEDQANIQEGDQPIRRLEDIVGSIRKDFTKVSPSMGSPGGLGETDNFIDERDLDSEASDDEDRQKKDPFNKEYEE